MSGVIKTASQEKKYVAMLSIVAAIFITLFKLLIGILTRSIGIISEALHSALDLVAAVITYFSVRVSDKPADEDHNFGHGKFENFSALIETIILLITCAWIIYEAIDRLTTGNVHIDINIWSYIVLITSIIIDFTRSRALSKAAKKHDSQALEADALHFSTDIYSSTVVIIGLICVQFGFFHADAIAALIVALIVIIISYRLGKRSIDILLDKSPKDKIEKINSILNNIDDITFFHGVRVRVAGADTFVDFNIHVNPKLTIEEAHDISTNIEKQIKSEIHRCQVLVHIEPEELK